MKTMKTNKTKVMRYFASIASAIDSAEKLKLENPCDKDFEMLVKMSRQYPRAGFTLEDMVRLRMLYDRIPAGFLTYIANF